MLVLPNCTLAIATWQVTPQLLLEYNTPRALAAQLRMLTSRDAGTSVMTPEQPNVSDSALENPGVSKSRHSAVLTAPPAPRRRCE